MTTTTYTMRGQVYTIPIGNIKDSYELDRLRWLASNSKNEALKQVAQKLVVIGSVVEVETGTWRITDGYGIEYNSDYLARQEEETDELESSVAEVIASCKANNIGQRKFQELGRKVCKSVLADDMGFAWSDMVEEVYLAICAKYNLTASNQI